MNDFINRGSRVLHPVTASSPKTTYYLDSSKLVKRMRAEQCAGKKLYLPASGVGLKILLYHKLLECLQVNILMYQLTDLLVECPP